MYNVRPGIMSPSEAQALQIVSDELTKSYITGNGIVASGNTTNAEPLRQQFLVNKLINTLYEQKHAVTMKHLPVVPVGSTIVEFSRLDMAGGAGDGFIGETGTDSAFGLTAGEDSFSRQTRIVKFLAAERQVGLVAQQVNNLENPRTIAETAATLEIIKNANLATLFGDSGFNTLSFDGIFKQLYDHLVASGNPSLWIDMNNTVVSTEAIMTAGTNVFGQFGEPSLLIQSAGSYNDTESSLLGQERGGFGYSGNGGIDLQKIKTSGGMIQRVLDPMLRPNRPLQLQSLVDVKATTGDPRAVADSGAYSFSATPWSTGAGNTVVQTAGSGPYYVNTTRSSDSTDVAIPALPSSVGGNGAASRLTAAGNYYYAASVVINGKESLAWVHGAAAVNSVTSAAALSPSATQVVQLKLLVASVTGYTAGTRTQMHFRIYRTGNLASAPTSMTQFKFLTQVGVSAAGTSCLAFDNGMYIPGTTINFLLTEKRDGRNAVIMGQLMEMMRRELPNLPLADQFCMLAFLTPIVFYGGFHAVFYNVREQRPFGS